MKRFLLIIPLLTLSFLFFFSSSVLAAPGDEGEMCICGQTKCSCNSSDLVCDGWSLSPIGGSNGTCIKQIKCSAQYAPCDVDPCCGALKCITQTGTVTQCVTADEEKKIEAARLHNPYIIFCDETKSSIKTALGCIKVGSPEDFIGSILRLAIGLGGGLALALILYGVFIVTTSAGIPDKLKAGSEIITSAVIGLIFMILSIFLVNLIGINILGIPGIS